MEGLEPQADVRGAPVVRIEGLEFRYRASDFRLSIDELSVEAGSSVAVIGPSGSGKTTLLNLVAGIVKPDAGRIVVDGTEIGELGDAARRAFRIARIGLVFQEFELLDYLSVLDNILLPYRIAPSLRLDAAVRDRAESLAGTVGLSDKLKRSTKRLSQGERQRVGVCRALLTEPPLILADEPTGNLDPANKGRVLDIVFERATASGATLLTVTHDHALLERFDRTLDVDDWGCA
jgi:putative ABC transport system ATP-binding protein